MIAQDSLQVRRSAIAYVFNRPLELQRAETLAFYDAITRAIGPYPELQHVPTRLAFRRRSPEHVGEVQVNLVSTKHATGIAIPAGMRFLFAEEQAAKPVSTIRSEADLAHDAFRNVWGERVGRVQQVEVSYNVTLSVNHPRGAPAFISERILTAAKDKGYLGREFPISSVRLRSGLVVDETPGVRKDLLSGSDIEVVLEPFGADDRQLWVSVILRWPTLQLNLQDLPLPKEARDALAGKTTIELNQEARSPSDYLGAGYQFIERNLLPYLYSLGRTHD